MEKKNIIISPHPDDEIIGCFSLIKQGSVKGVIYIDPDYTRFELAQIAGKEMGFLVAELKFKDLPNLLEARAYDFMTPDVAYVYSYLGLGGSQLTYWVPDVADNHLLHKAVNLTGRMSSNKLLGYYSVDMNTGYVRELSDEMKKEKREMLEKYYPDQISLWKNNWKYFLFEGTVYDASTASIAS
jgi:hypothetical protein